MIWIKLFTRFERFKNSESSIKVSEYMIREIQFITTVTDKLDIK